MRLVRAIGHALELSGLMTWQILWTLIIGFAASAWVQATIRRQAIVERLGGDDARSLVWASALGCASSSCSYAAVALARTLFRKGASFTSALVFEIASTNLIIELGVVMAVVLGWRFTLSEFVGAPVMILVVVLVLRLVVSPDLVAGARRQAEMGRAGAMEGHAAMDMAVDSHKSWWRRATSGPALTSVSHIFGMEVTAVGRDLLIGLLAAGSLGAWVPNSFWHHLFVSGHPLAARIWGPIIGPVIAMVSCVCSIGNVPLAAVLWGSGIGFGGVVAFILADLVILPIIAIYRRYYGTKMTVLIVGSLYAASVLAGYAVEILFGLSGLTPARKAPAALSTPPVHWDATTGLNIAAVVLALMLAVRFVRTGGRPMLSMMGGEPQTQDHDPCHGEAAA